MDFNSLTNAISHALPGIFGALLLLIVALILAWIAKKGIMTVLDKMNFDQQLQRWGLAKSSDESNIYIKTIASIVYFVIIVLFLPSILSGLNVGGVLNPIVNLFSTFLAFVPNFLIALIIIILGGYFCNFIKRLIKNLFMGLNVDKWYQKVTKQTRNHVDVDDHNIAEVLATIVYVIIYIPIITVALETLGIKTISAPIIAVLNQILGAIPNIFAALVLLIVGGFIGKLIGDVVQGLLSTSGVDKYSKFLNINGESKQKISGIIGKIIQALLSLFFLVEAISILKLEVLNNIGTGIISYLPALISGLIVLGIGLIGGNIFANFIEAVSGSKLFGELVRYIILAIAIFMTLDQLKIAQTIVNTSFIMIMGSLAGAFILAFGIGGKDFAKMKLEEMNETMTKESEKKDMLQSIHSVNEEDDNDTNDK